MSIEAIKWAVEQAPPMPAQLVATLIGLANHADPKGRGAYPSIATLAAYTCKSDRSVRRDLRELEQLELIRPGDPAKTAHLPSDRRPEVYDLAVERVVPEGRAGKDEGTRASGRTLVSSRARGGKKTTSSDDVRGDVDVRADVDVTPGRGRHERADVDVTTGGTWASAKPSVEPPDESLSRVPQQPLSLPGDQNDERENSRSNEAEHVIAAYEDAAGRPLIGEARDLMLADAAIRLEKGIPVGWLIDRARELPARGWKNLGQHCDRSTVPTIDRRPDGLPAPCAAHDKFNRLIRGRNGELIPCPDCDPAAIARARRQGAA